MHTKILFNLDSESLCLPMKRQGNIKIASPIFWQKHKLSFRNKVKHFTVKLKISLYMKSVKKNTISRHYITITVRSLLDNIHHVHFIYFQTITETTLRSPQQLEILTQGRAGSKTGFVRIDEIEAITDRARRINLHRRHVQR